MPRGGARTGRPGVAYPVRSDMQSNPRAPATPVHGDIKRREQVKAATPDTVNTGPLPGQLTSLSAPTERPEEPVTAGLPIGPGPGPKDAMTPIGRGDDDLAEMRFLYGRTRRKDLARLIALAEESL